MYAVLLALGLSAAWSSSALPPLKRGESYPHARKHLIEHGWRPVETSGKFADGTLFKEFGDAGEMLKAGFKEIADCSGTGVNYCTFIWKRRGRCIHVITRGEFAPDVGALPRVFRVLRGSCSRGD